MITVTVRGVGYRKIYQNVQEVVKPGGSFQYWLITTSEKKHFIHTDEVKMLDIKDTEKPKEVNESV